MGYKLSKDETHKRFTIICSDNKNTVIKSNSLTCDLVKSVKKSITKIIDNNTEKVIYERNTSQIEVEQ